MPWLLNALYLLAILVLSPWLVYRALTTGKYRRGMRDKLLGLSHSPFPSRPSPLQPVWFHGVSVGEIHLLRQLVGAFRRRHPQTPVVLSTTTDTGFDEARRCFPDLPVIFYPLDFSWAVGRTLDAVRPSLVVLAESELWPNFLLAARRRGVPVAVVNGRMSPRSFARYRRLGAPARWLLHLVDRWAVQTDEYAHNLTALGVAAAAVRVTGSVKYDGATTDRDNPRTADLRRLLGVTADDLVWVAGSTQAPEEEIALDVFRRAREAHPNLRLFLVPRQRDRFDEVARLLDRGGLPFARRSRIGSAECGMRNGPGSFPIPHSPFPIVLVDTIGELGALWGLADVAFVGGSLDGRRGGQNMIEPAAYGAAVVFGPHVWNFRDTAERLVAAGAARQVRDGDELDGAVRRLLADAGERRQMGEAARAFVRAQQGATERTLAVLDGLRAGPGEAQAA